ncbi:phage/plasmid primase, P4 family, partial [Paracoccaceae bacterium]|nr:phage/plasmid primase, P4 family [Paracoccaceae bacterium]
MANFAKIIPAKQECFIILANQSKKPVSQDWLSNGKTLANATADSKNIGLLLGEKSGALDVDLDCMEAKILAEIILPEPAAKFDRGSPESGHFLYKASSCGPRKKFGAEGPNSTLVELRGDGAQTMVPPSVHPNGKILTFTALSEETTKVEYDDLLKSVSFLAACSEVTQNWSNGRRHDLVLAFSGFCLKKGIEPDLLMNIVQRICEIADDHEVDDRLNAIRTSYAKPADSLLGYKGLVDCLGQAKAKRIADRITAYTGGELLADIVLMEPIEGDLVNFGQFSDRSNVTEARMGIAFGQWLKGKAVYATEKKQWMIWNANHWKNDQCAFITKLAYQFVTEAKAALFEGGNYTEASNLSAFESLNRLENISKFAATDCSVSALDFDADPFLLATLNNWIDLKTGQPSVPNPEVLVSKALSVGYLPDAECPKFLRFLNDIFENDRELIEFVQQAVGYSLTGSTSEQCLFIMIGDGANGKSTFINVINKLLGSYATSAASHTLIANGGGSIGDDLVDLIGARLITVSETEEGQSLAEAKIKQMTGGDTLKGRPLYGTYVQFEIIGKLWLATNSLPQINNTDHGIWRRIRAIPFNRTFTAQEQDKHLSDQLMEELPGILNWAIQGCLRWQKNELQVPQIIEDQISEYKSAMDSISQFIREECELGKDHSCAASKFFQAYRDWCSGAGRKPQSATAFKRALEKLTGVYQHRSSNGLQWHGIQPCLAY